MRRVADLAEALRHPMMHGIARELVHLLHLDLEVIARPATDVPNRSASAQRR